MKKFIFKILFFILPLSLLFIEGFLPLSTFTFRPWEALRYIHTGLPMPFYPNQEIQMITVGELCPRTKYAIKKNEKWITDELGFRNNHFIKDPDVLLVGDSFTAGATFTQDSILANILMQKSNYGVDVYSIAPASFADFIILLENKIIEQPKIVVFSRVERANLKSINNIKPIEKNQNVNSYTIWKNKFTRMYLLEFLMARTKKRNELIIQGKEDSNMFFLRDIREMDNSARVKESVQNIVTYKKYCDSIGVHFIYLPMPNKETVYYEKVPLEKQPDYLLKLDSVLIKRNIETINTLKIYNEYRKSNDELLYHLDDTHWNSNGLNLISDILLDRIYKH